FPQRYVDPTVARLDSVDCVVAYSPRALVRRFIQQSSIFTYHPVPDRPLEPEPLPAPLQGENLLRVIIPSAAKVNLLDTLEDYGVTEVTLFPDLEGLSRHVNWQTSRIIRRRMARTSGQR